MVGTSHQSERGLDIFKRESLDRVDGLQSPSLQEIEELLEQSVKQCQPSRAI